MGAVVLHKVGFLEYFCPQQGQDFKPQGHPYTVPKHESSTPIPWEFQLQQQCSYQYYVRGKGIWDEVGTLNVLVHPRWGILANFEHKCWPWDREVRTMLKRQKQMGFECRELGYECSTILKVPRISRSSNFPVTIKWRNKRNLTNHCFFFNFNILVLVHKYFVSIPKSYRI